MPDLARLKAVRTVVGSLRGDIPYPVGRATETHEYAGPVRRRRRCADVWVPDVPNGRSVLLVHGGGFIMGARDMKPTRVVAHDLVTAGVTVCAIDYRLFPMGRVPDMRDDVILALFWWLEELERRGLDAGGLTLVGASAGGTLVSLANEVAPHGAVDRLVLLFPLLDIEALTGRGTRVLLRLLFPKGRADRWSPVRQCQRDTPVFIHQGTDDLLVTELSVQRAVEGLRQRGAPVTVHRYNGAPHGFLNDPVCEHAVLARQRIVAEVLDAGRD